METKASVRYIRIAPRKMRTVVNMIRGKDLGTAHGILATNNKLGISRILAKLLNQATANAKENMNLDIDALYLKTISVDDGPSLKRFLPRMRGRADRILKRTSQITVILDERVQKSKAAKATAKTGSKTSAKAKGDSAAKKTKAAPKAKSSEKKGKA